MREQIKFTGEIWEYGGKASWYFITLPVETAEVIKELNTAKRGFGSVKVQALIGETIWLTSLFPDTKSNSFLLPIKKEIRKINNLEPGYKTEVKLYIIGA